MATLVNRTLSLLVYATYLVAAYHFAGPGAVLKIGMFLLLPMACIWFPEALGQYTGMMHYHSITSPTPAVLVCAAGWLIMVGLPLLVYCVGSGTP